MKMLFRKLSNFTLLPLLLLSSYSCTKTNNDDLPPPDVSTSLLFESAMITDPIDVTPELRSSSAPAKHGLAGFSNTVSVPSNEIIELHRAHEGEFDAIATLEQSSSRVSNNSNTELKSVQSQRKFTSELKSETMLDGRRYRVLIYDNDDVYQGTLDATAGQQVSIPFPVYQKTTYKWYAYSFNSTTQVPIPANTSSPVLSVPQGSSDLLHAAGTITTVAGSNKINIQFDRKLAVIKVRLDARGMFSPINTVTGSYATATTGAVRGAGVLNLKTGAYQSTTASSSSSLTWMNESSATGDSVKMAYIYTTGSSSITGGITVTLSNLQLKLDNTQRPTRTFTDRSFTFSTPFTPTFGNRYTINITLLESPVTIGNIEWARANLYYRSADNGYRFRQQSSNIYNTASNPAASGEYWNWRAAAPGASAASNVVDPCTRVFPARTWRMPTNAEMQNLASVTNRSWGTTDTPLVRYVAWINGANNEYGINWTSWLSFGYRNQGSNTISDYTAGSTYSGYWWTSTSAGSTTANAFRVQYTENASGTITTGLAQARSLGLNVRCVRN